MIALPENIEIPRPSHTAQTRWALPADVSSARDYMPSKCQAVDVALFARQMLAGTRPSARVVASLSVGIGSSSEFGSLSVTEGDGSFSILGFCGYWRLPLEEHRCV